MYPKKRTVLQWQLLADARVSEQLFVGFMVLIGLAKTLKNKWFSGVFAISAGG
jgi:hypothetical protein